MEFEQSEQEEVEALQKWWQENWMAVIGGLVIGVGGILGWQQYGDYQRAQAAEASQLFDQVKEASVAGDLDKAGEAASSLRGEYAKSPYSAHAQFTLAAAAAEKGDWDQAISSLQWVLNESGQDELLGLARLRLARAHWGAGDVAAAISQIQGAQEPVAFAPLYAELEGDLQVAQGNADAARSAYENALKDDKNLVNRADVERKIAALN